MAEYIEREALCKRIEKEMELCNSGITYGVLKYLKTSLPPIVDVAEVVRCKDCCHGRNNNCVHGEDSVTYDPEWFCADGEKMIVDNG